MSQTTMSGCRNRPVMAHRRRQQSGQRRHIPPDVWELHREEIQDLYVNRNPPYTLKQLRSHMLKTHLFDAS